MRYALLVAVALGCGGTEAPVGPTEPIGDKPAAEPLPMHMKEHFEWAVAARDAVIRGEPLAAKEPLKALVEHPTAGGLPDGWEPYVAEMRTVAGEGAVIDNDESAGRAVGLVVAQCGSCHAAMATAIAPPPVHVPEGDGTKEHMGRHAVAADRMWWSLVVPSPSLWEEGAAALAEHPIATVPGAAGPEALPPELAVYATRVHELAESGLRATSTSARAELYGQMIAACGACHRARAVEPFPK